MIRKQVIDVHEDSFEAMQRGETIPVRFFYIEGKFTSPNYTISGPIRVPKELRQYC